MNSFVATALALLCLSFDTLGAPFAGASEPPVDPVSPVTPAEQARRFSLPPGFEVELVASEEEGAGKPITVTWDDSGRMWSMTALEYPLDGNEQPEAAKALYERGGQDKVLVFDDPYGPGPSLPRVFAEGLAMPMGIIPYQDGVLVGHGPDLLFLRDTDGDGRADTREVILTGFGIQDSHLMPHQFMRAPGGWFYLAQGAFNYSRVRTKDGREHPFDQTRLARFTADGMRFEDLTSGPCNIWGLVIGREGETFIQEANDYGYPVMAFHAGASYPGCSGAFKPYAPYFPSEIEFRMGGTGLSGLALSDPAGSFPGAYADVMYVANPITRKIQAIKIHRDGPRYRYEKLPDFMLSSDEWFRPVAIHFGPDGCLYVVDWYNKVISHNEVPRTHPERDKTRGRIWRVRHKQQERVRPPDLAKAGGAELARRLQSESTWEMRAAWHQIVDREVRDSIPDLQKIVEDRSASATHRIHALWTLEELKAVPSAALRLLLADPNRNLRREALRAISTLKLAPELALEFASAHTTDPDPEVRAEVIRVASLYLPGTGAMRILSEMAKPALNEPAGKNPHNGSLMKLREAYDREFERYLVRSIIEKYPGAAKEQLSREGMSVEAQLLFALALPADQGSAQIARLLPKLERAPNEEELLRLAENLRGTEALESLQALLDNPSARRMTIEALMKVRDRIDIAALGEMLAVPLQALWQARERETVARAAGAFKVRTLAPALEEALDRGDEGFQVVLLRALREIDVTAPEKLAALARSAGSRAVRDEAFHSLANTRLDASAFLVEFWPSLTALQKRSALRSLTVNAIAARRLLAGLKEGTIHERELDGEHLEQLAKTLGTEPAVQELIERLSSEFRSVLRLDGKTESYVDANLTLDGPFTVECWVRLESGIGNEDGILGVPGGADFNFAGGRFRVYCGPEFGDRAIARKPMTPHLWTHLAVTRDADGVFRLYQNGELDNVDVRPVTAPLANLDIGRTTPGGGTSGEIAEFRVWQFARGSEEIRADFDRSFESGEQPSGLAVYFPGGGDLPARGGARIVKTADAPALLSQEQARELQARFEHFKKIADEGGDFARGREIYASACASCHAVSGQGGQIGPVLNGAAANGVDSMLRAILTPNAAMEAGYRTFRVELTDDEMYPSYELRPAWKPARADTVGGCYESFGTWAAFQARGVSSATRLAGQSPSLGRMSIR